MYKEELARKVAEKAGITRVSAEAAIDAFTAIVGDVMKRGEKVTITGFGVFEPKLMSPRIGRNPHTREPVNIPARVRPVFKASKALNDLLCEDPQITSLPPKK